jgi:hypothetical protein
MTTDAAGLPAQQTILLASLVDKIDEVLNAVRATDACLAASTPGGLAAEALRRQLDDFAVELTTARRTCCAMIAANEAVPPPVRAGRRSTGREATRRHREELPAAPDSGAAASSPPAP